MLPTSQPQVIQQQPNNNSTPSPDPWAVAGQLGAIGVLVLTIGKAWADYQLKAAMEDRALKSKSEVQSLELESRVFGSLLSQQESSVKSTGELLNTFIAKTLNQAEVNSEQTSSLIETIGTLTEAIKFLGDTQQQQTAILYELKEYSEAHNSELAALRDLKITVLDSINLNISITNQVLSLVKKLIESMSSTNING